MSAGEKLKLGAGSWRLGKELAEDKINYATKFHLVGGIWF